MITTEEIKKIKEYIKAAVYAYTTGEVLAGKSFEDAGTELDNISSQ